MKKVQDKLLSLKNDLVFQELFGNPKNRLITGHLLSLILNRKVSNVNLDLNKRMLGKRADSKVYRLDLRVKFNDGEDCNIELQVKQFAFMPERMLEYWATMYSNKLSSGERYNTLKPSISILIACHKLPELKDISSYHTVWSLKEKNHIDCNLTDHIELHILEIPKIKETEILTDELAQWLKFIDNSENKEVEKLMFMSENKYYKQAREELEYLSGDECFQRQVEARAWYLMDQDVQNEEREKKAKAEGLKIGKADGMAEGIAKGLSNGIAKGKKEKQIEIAKKMKTKNMPLKEIIELTGLTKEEIEKL